MARARNFVAGALVCLVGGAALTGCGSRPSADADSSGSTQGAVGDVSDESRFGHRLREIPPEGAPKVKVTAKPDPHGGWNVHLSTSRFRFAPEQVNTRVRANTGHAHLYIDGQKVARLYSPWFHLAPENVGEGEHTMQVTLNANDHTLWAINDKLISAHTTITGEKPGRSHDHHHDGEGADHHHG